MGFLVLLLPIITSSTAQVFLKKGMMQFGSLEISLSNVFYLIPRIFKNIWLMGGIVLYGISLFSYIFALANLQLSIAYPAAVSGAVILVFIASRFLFKEVISLYQILGMIIIISGIFLLVTKW